MTVSSEGIEMKLEVKLSECVSGARLLGELSHFCAPVKFDFEAFGN